MDGQRCFFMPTRVVQQRFVAGKLLYDMKYLSFAIIRSTNHGLICLALPSKLFKVDLIVCMDISPNPASQLGFELKST